MGMFESIVESIEKAPMTFLPALLKIVAEQCVKKECFNPGGMAVLVNNVEGRAPGNKEQPANTAALKECVEKWLTDYCYEVSREDVDDLLARLTALPSGAKDTQPAIVPEVCEAFTEWNDGPDRIFSDRLLNALHTLVEQQTPGGHMRDTHDTGQE